MVRRPQEDPTWERFFCRCGFKNDEPGKRHCLSRLMERGYLLQRHRSLNKGGKLNAKVEIGSSNFRTDNRRSYCLECAGSAANDFAAAKSVGSPAGRLHQRWSALPIRTCLGLSSAVGVLLCTLRPLLWRALAVSVTPLALALLADP